MFQNLDDRVVQVAQLRYDGWSQQLELEVDEGGDLTCLYVKISP